MNKEKAISYLVYLPLVLLVSYFVGVRDFSIGTDTAAYARIFFNIEHFEGRHELGFKVFSFLLFYFFESVQIYFIFIFLFVLFFMYRTFSAFSREVVEFNGLGLFSSIGFFLLFVLASDWFLVATTNGIRQGMALSLLYFSFSYLYLRKRKSALFAFFVSFLFHKSVIFALPFCFVINRKELRLQHLHIAVFVTAAMYYLGINEVLLSKFSGVLNIGLYDELASYGSINDKYRGFNWIFVGYSLFWYVVFTGAFHSKIINRTAALEFALKLYGVFLLIYFLLGFTAFANRWAFFAWLFIPVLQAIYTVHLKMHNYVRVYVSLFSIFVVIYFIQKMVL